MSVRLLALALACGACIAPPAPTRPSSRDASPQSAANVRAELTEIDNDAMDALSMRSCWQAIELTDRGLALADRESLGQSNERLELLSTRRMAEDACGRDIQRTLKLEIELVSKLEGGDHPRVLWLLSILAERGALAGAFAEARRVCAEQTTRARRLAGDKGPQFADAVRTCALVVYRECRLQDTGHLLDQALAACPAGTECDALHGNVSLLRSAVWMHDEHSFPQAVHVLETLAHRLRGSRELRRSAFPAAEERLAELYRALNRPADERRVLEDAWKFVVTDKLTWEREQARIALLLYDFYEREGDAEAARALNSHSGFALSSRAGPGMADARLDARAVALDQSEECRVTKAEWDKRDEEHGQATLAIHRKFASCFGTAIAPEVRMADFLLLVDAEGRVVRATVVGTRLTKDDLTCMLDSVVSATLPIQDSVPRRIELSHSPDAPNARP